MPSKTSDSERTSIAVFKSTKRKVKAFKDKNELRNASEVIEVLLREHEASSKKKEGIGNGEVR